MTVSRRNVARSPSPGLRATGLVALLLAAAWSVAIGYAIHGQMPANALELPFESAIRPHLPYVAPQGWAFFTRSPREERLLAFRRSGDRWQPANLGPHAEAANLFGFDRRSRAQGVEIGLLLGSVATRDWPSCDGGVPRCLERPARVVAVSNVSPAPSLCGRIALVRAEPVPWAWRAAAGEVSMPARSVQLDVAC